MSSTTDHTTDLPANSAAGAREPIAIIGIGCRFPGAADTPAAFWKLLSAGVDAIGEVPNTRFDIEHFYDPRPATPGRVMSRWGGFLERIDHFDAAFFGIAPREADRLDPQQRLLLETAWEAMEDAGQTPERLSAGSTGVFVGMWLNDYEARMFADPEQTDFYMTIGSGRYSASGRISYAFDFQGPSITIDTACSSSLVAVHLACQSIWSGESAVAFAGGANIILQPQITIAYSQSKMMATDGHCKFGDADANGYVRSEGAAVVMLKPLAQAQAAGDPIYAVIRGSAVTNDGRSSGFLAAPGQHGQEEMLRRAYANANVDPRHVQYVEAHGTGTRVGDPVELGALGAVLGAGRDAQNPCIVGSVKTNIGHTEGAAGLAGLIKVALSLKHRQIPATLHLREPNPAIPWDDLHMVVRSEMLDWPSTATPRLAGVSAFGIAGTNAHVVLEEAPHSEPAPSTYADGRAQLLLLSARSPEALAVQARSLKEFAANVPSLPDLSYTTSSLRAHHDHRLAIAARDHADLRDQLDAFAADEARPTVVSGQAGDEPLRAVFVFPGQGSQWNGMARRLLAEEPIFRAAIERCDQAIQAEAGWSLLAELTAENNPRLQEIDIIQPALFAIQVSLAALWQAWGIVPVAVVGHSMGEVAAAHVAGILSLKDAVAVICRRSRLLRRISGQGMMAAVELTIEQARTAIAGYEDRLAIAVSNSPSSTVLSGDPSALNEVLEQLQQRNIFCRRVKVDVASHSPQVDPLRDELLAALADLRPQTATTPFFSTVTVTYESGAECDARYWERNLRQPVMFASAVRQLLDDGNSLFIEISPHPVLLPAIESTFQQFGRQGHTVASLRRDCDEPASMLAALGQLYTLGYPINWRAFQPNARQFVKLPPYPWQRERFWYDPAPAQQPTARAADRGAEHPLLGRRLPALAHLPNSHFWQLDLDSQRMAGQRLNGVAVLPPAIYTQLALAAAEVVIGPASLEQLTLHDALVFAAGSPAALQIILTAPELQIFGRSAATASWTLLASTQIVARATTATAIRLADAQADCRHNMAGAAYYERLAASGIALDNALRGIKQIWSCSNQLLAELAQPATHILTDGELPAAFALDVAFQLLPDAGDAASGRAYAPASVERIHVYDRQATAQWAYARLRQADDTSRVVDVNLLDSQGEPVADLIGVGWRPLDAALPNIQRARVQAWVHALEWQADMRKAAAPAATQPGKWLILADRGGVAEALAALLDQAGKQSTLAFAGDTFAKTSSGHFTLNPQRREDMQRLIAELRSEATQRWRGVVYLWPLDILAEDIGTGSEWGGHIFATGSATMLVQALDGGALPGAPRLWLVTRGAQPAGPAPTALALGQSPLWGLGRVVALEHPQLWGGIVDLDPTAAPNASALLSAIQTAENEDQIALRDDQRYLARIVARPEAGNSLTLRADGTYLITGGLGGLGLQVARWLADRGARHLALIGRSAPSAAAQTALHALEQRGVQVTLLRGDVSLTADVGPALATIARDMPPLRGVFHAAGVLDDRLLLQQDQASFARVFAPKVAGAWNLHTLTRDLALDHFVMFSSVMALLGMPGQANYAAANAFLDALAHLRAADGLPVLSINWGWWGDAGLASRADRSELLARRGLRAMAPADGVAALEQLISLGHTQRAVLDIDWPTYVQQLPRGRETALFRELVGAVPVAADAADVATPAHAHSILQLTDTPAEQRLELLQEYVRDQVAAVLRFKSGQRIGMRQGFFQIGMDSLTSMELRNRLQVALDRPLPPTLAFDYPTIITLTQYLSDLLYPAVAAATIAPDTTALEDAQAEAIDTLSSEELRLLIDAELDSIEEGLFG